MNRPTHPQLVAALVKPPQAILDTLTDFRVDLWHAATGIAGEGGELLEVVVADTLDRENIVEELGDLEFYMQQLRSRLGFSRDDSADVTASNLVLEHADTGKLEFLQTHIILAAIASSAVLDLVKKVGVYDKPITAETNSAIMDALRKLDVSMGVVRNLLDIARTDEVLEHNIDKLMVRYEGLNYSDKAAHDRADKPAERKFFSGEPINGDTADMVERIAGQQ